MNLQYTARHAQSIQTLDYLKSLKLSYLVQGNVLFLQF